MKKDKTQTAKWQNDDLPETPIETSAPETAEQTRDVVSDALTPERPQNEFGTLERLFEKSPTWQKEIWINRAKKDPWGIFDDYDQFKDKPWAKEVVAAALEQDDHSWGSLFWVKASQFRDQPWAKEIAIEVVNKNPELASAIPEALRYLDDELETLIAEKDPTAAISNLYDYEKDAIHWADRQMTENIEKMNPGAALYHAALHKNFWSGMAKAIEAKIWGDEVDDTYYEARNVLMDEMNYREKYEKEMKEWKRLQKSAFNSLIEFIGRMNPGMPAEEMQKQAEGIFEASKGTPFAEQGFNDAFAKLVPRLDKEPALWHSLIYPTMMSQKPEAYWCLEDLHKLDKWLNEKTVDLFRFITTEKGKEAHKILESFLLEGLKQGAIENLESEKNLILEFFQKEAEPRLEAYKKFKEG